MITYGQALTKILKLCVAKECDEQCEECNIRAIKDALEKQIPKSKHKYQGYRCVCGQEVAKNQAFCEYCGQALFPYDDNAKTIEIPKWNPRRENE